MHKSRAQNFPAKFNGKINCPVGPVMSGRGASIFAGKFRGKLNSCIVQVTSISPLNLARKARTDGRSDEQNFGIMGRIKKHFML